MGNVLIFFMSTRNAYSAEIYYKYGKRYKEDGINLPQTTHTNLGTAKALAYSIGQIDKVCYLASKSVRKLKADGSDEAWFKRELDAYLDTLSKGSKRKKVLYKSVKVADDFSDKTIMKSAIKLIDRIDVKEGDHVYIDFTGGIRQAASILLAVGKILELKSINVILLTNQYNRDKKDEYKDSQTPLKVVENKNVSSGMDYVSATQYFLKTGDISQLKIWFENNERSLNGIENDIIKRFEKFYKSISLCRADVTTDCWNEIRSDLDAYEKNKEKTLTFAYVVDLLTAEMEKGGDNSIVSLIYWCLKHNFVQQAVTIFNEKIPGVVHSVLTKQELLYLFPTEIKNKNLKNSYLGIYEHLLDETKSSKEDLKDLIEFKKMYLLLDAVRDYTNHASGEENRGEVGPFLIKMKQENFILEDNIDDFLENVEEIKQLILTILDNIEIYKAAWEKYKTKEK